MMKEEEEEEETQWNDAQIRFGPYNSTLINKSRTSLDEKEHNNNNNITITTTSSITKYTNSDVTFSNNDNDNNDKDNHNDEYYGANVGTNNDHDRETFTFTFQIKLDDNHDNRKYDNGDDEKKENDKNDHQLGDTSFDTSFDITIKLQGFQQQSNITYCSTGLTLWPAAENICHYLVNNPNFLQGKRILELGSGLGLVGLLSHQMTYYYNDHQKQQLGNYQNLACVHLTDGDTDALSNLRHNIAMNHKLCEEDMDAYKNPNIEGPLSCNQLLWSKANAELYLKKKCHGQKFNVILASDIIYAKSVVEPMWESVQVLLSEEDGRFLFAFARRQVAVSIKDILDMGESKGFEYSVCEETNPQQDLFVYMFKRRRKEQTTENRD